jgi:hypothetical protein
MPGGRGKAGPHRVFLEGLLRDEPHLNRPQVNSRLAAWIASSEHAPLAKDRRAHLVSAVWAEHWVRSHVLALLVAMPGASVQEIAITRLGVTHCGFAVGAHHMARPGGCREASLTREEA